MGSIEKRVKRLERLVIVLVAALGLAGLMAAKHSDDATFGTVKAREFVVVDGKGIPRVTMDERALEFASGGKTGPAMILSSDGRGPSFTMNHADGGTIVMTFGGPKFGEGNTPNIWALGPKGDLVLEVPKGKTFISNAKFK